MARDNPTAAAAPQTTGTAVSSTKDAIGVVGAGVCEFDALFNRFNTGWVTNSFLPFPFPSRGSE